MITEMKQMIIIISYQHNIQFDSMTTESAAMIPEYVLQAPTVPCCSLACNDV